ncbi:MAG: NAD(P)/FAD-dependent oxidoreductase [Planctomycetota bacterium]|nr:NAD(P)/FAD-dependent oxidoreductase [Planctomycetota bacterium]
MEIAIAGCGITGTAAACLLAREGHRVTLYERSSVCGPIGAGLMLQPSGQQVLADIGLLEQVEACSTKLKGMTARQISGKPLVRLRYEHLKAGLHGLGVHRGRLFQLLYDSCQQAGAEVKTGRQVRGYRASSVPVEKKTTLLLETENGIEEDGEFDFIIAADGSHSALRDQLANETGQTPGIIDYDHAALWMTSQSDYQSDELLQVVDGTQKLLGLLPIGGNECSFFWGLKADAFEQLQPADFEPWKQEVIQTCPAAAALLKDKTGFEEFTFARYRHVRVKRCFDQQVILLGDAAHATSPHLGQGANLGLQDAWLFAEALASSRNDFTLACRSFARARRRQVRYYQTLTRHLTPFFQSDSWWRGKLRDTFLPWIPSVPLVRREMLRTLCGLKRGWLG